MYQETLYIAQETISNPYFFLPMSIFISLFIGSFLNVLIYRFHTQKDRLAIFTGGRSYCVHCQHTLGSLDLIPVISYLLRRGKCHYCHQVISPWYASGELFTAATLPIFVYFSFNLLKSGITSNIILTLLVIVLIILGCALIVHLLSDLHYSELPDEINIILVPTSLILLFIIHAPILSSLIGALIPLIFFLLINAISKKFYGKVGIGGGDIKLAPTLGLILGTSSSIAWLMLSYLLGALIGIIIIAIYGRDRYIPFGPFLIIAFITTLFYGPQLIQWYLKLINV